MAASERAFSTNFDDHTGLVHNFARKGWGRMLAAHVNVEYEDVFQEMSVTFTKAVRTFDPSKGVAFTSYMGRAIWNDFNRYAQKHIDERMQLGLVSMDNIEGEDDNYFAESLASDERTPEESLERKQDMLEKLRALSPTAKFLAAQLISPPAALEEAFAAHQAEAVESGGRRVVGMTLRFIGSFYQIDARRMSAAIKELKTRYGV